MSHLLRKGLFPRFADMANTFMPSDDILGRHEGVSHVIRVQLYCHLVTMVDWFL